MIGSTLCLRTLFYFYFLLVPQLLLRTDAIPVCWVFRQTPLGKSSSSSNSNNLKVQRQSNCPLLCFTAPIFSSSLSSFICYYYGDEYGTIIIEIVYRTIIIKMNQIDTVAQCNISSSSSSSSSNSNSNSINTRHLNNTTRTAKVIVHNNQ